MNGIKLLENNLINKIAAGEVVERPASAVKELMENSIDAGATSVTVEISGGGIDFIKVTDNGKGIPADEVKTAFLRHATSKLRKIEDLDDIMTLGFRGEALSSIASVAQVEMLTKTSEQELGVRIVINGGKVEKEEKYAANTGTVFTMKNLFYNTPARRKFLKKAAVEGGYVSEAVQRIALGHPEVAIKYINNGNTVLQTSGNNDMKTAVLYIFGKTIANEMLNVSCSKAGYNINGLIAKPELSRGSRGYEYFFINGRYIKSSVVSEAIEDAYKGRLMVGKFPVFMLNMTVPANTVDVNVHPTKLEVRFSDDSLIYDIIYDAVTKTLKDTNLIPNVSWDREKKAKPEPVQQIKLDESNSDIRYDDISYKAMPAASPIVLSDSAGEKSKKPVSKAIDTLYPNTEEKEIKILNSVLSENAERIKAESVPEKKPFFNNYRIIGQIFGTYWIIEQNNSMYLIDQHAAHERALYEEFIEKFKSSSPSSQRLVQPIAVDLTEKEKVILEENMELLESFGFEIEEFGRGTYALRAVPYIFNSPGNVGFFTDIIDALEEKNIKSIYDTREDAIATMSCKAAVKGNDRLSFSEAQALIQKILKLENPFSCPHGRPTVIEMTRYELEKKFKRIQDR